MSKYKKVKLENESNQLINEIIQGNPMEYQELLREVKHLQYPSSGQISMEIFDVLRKTLLVGIHSDDYEQGFWDCYRQISDNLEKHFLKNKIQFSNLK